MSTRETPSPAGAPGTIERRAAERVAVDHAVTVNVEGMSPLAGRVCNLSINGALLALAHGLPLGAEARLEFGFDDDPAPLEVRGLVVRVLREPGGDRPMRVAFCFIQPPASAVRRLSRLLFA